MPRLFLGNLSYNIDEQTLTEAIESFGIKVTDVKIIKDRETGGGRGFGFCETADPNAAIAALNDAVIGGRPIRVDHAAQKPQASRPRAGGTGGGRDYRDDNAEQNQRRGRR